MTKRITTLASMALVVLAVVVGAKERKWQTGTWVDVGTKRQVIDFGPGSSSFDPQGRNMAMRAMADVRTFVIETAALRLELQDVVSVNKRSVEVVVGKPVTFALEGNSVYVKDDDGAEHKLRVTKKTNK